MSGFVFSRFPSTQTKATVDVFGQAKADNSVVLIGHAAAGASADNIGKLILIENFTDELAAKDECTALFGANSEIGEMVVSAICAVKYSNLNPKQQPPIYVLVLASGDDDIETLLAANGSVQMPYVAPWFGADNVALSDLKDHLALISGPDRGIYGQFQSHGFCALDGTLGTVSPIGIATASENIIIPWLKDTEVTKSNKIHEINAALAAVAAVNPTPFNPMNGITIGKLKAPTKRSDHLAPDVTGEASMGLAAGLTPLMVNFKGEVEISRLITTRRNVATEEDYAYFDLPDWQVLSLYRKNCFLVRQQAKYLRAKSNSETLKNLKSEFLKIAKDFEEQGMFQAVDKLAPFFELVKDPTSRSNYTYRIPVNVTPGLHSVGMEAVATTQFDVIKI